MKSFKQWFDGLPGEECDQDTRNFAGAAWNACDQQWREELGKDRGVKSYDDWWHYSKDGEDRPRNAWTACESLWRHKCLNIEQASSMKIAILERQLSEVIKDLDKATGAALEMSSFGFGHDTIKEIRQRHKLDEEKL